MRIAVLRHVAGLAPLGRGKIEVRPIEPRRLVPPARHHDQEPGEVAPDRLPQRASGYPEPRKLGRGQIVRAGLRRLGAARAGDQGAGVGLDMPGVLAPIQKARQGAEPLACGRNATGHAQQAAHFRISQVGRGHVLGFHVGERLPSVRQFIGDILRGGQAGAAHLWPAGQAARVVVQQASQRGAALAPFIRRPRLLLGRRIAAGGSLTLDPVCLGAGIVGRMRGRVAQRDRPVRPAASCHGIGPARPVGIAPRHRGWIYDQRQAAAVLVAHDQPVVRLPPPPCRVDRRLGDLGGAFADDLHGCPVCILSGGLSDRTLTGHRARRQAESCGNGRGGEALNYSHCSRFW